jgi:DNA gyrase subunit A
MGVRGISMSFSDDFVVGMLVVKRDGSILAATDKGYGKRTDVEAYRTQNRGGKGVYTIKCNDKIGKLVTIMEVVDTDDIMIITDQGIMIRQPVESINVIGRNTQGVRLLKLDDGAKISTITKVLKDDDDGEDEPGEVTEE